MAIVPEEEDYISRPRTVADKVSRLERELDLRQKQEDTERRRKRFKWPFKWQWKLNQAKKLPADMVLVLFFNKKNEIETPVKLPIYSGNMVVYKNKAYEFDPRAIWRMKTKGYPMVYCIKEIDRRPVRNKFGEVVYKDSALSNLDIEEIRNRGDSTESDEFLIKAALKAQTASLAGKNSYIVAGIVLLVLVGGLIWFLSSGKV